MGLVGTPRFPPRGTNPGLVYQPSVETGGLPLGFLVPILHEREGGRSRQGVEVSRRNAVSASDVPWCLASAVLDHDLGSCVQEDGGNIGVPVGHRPM